MSRWRLPRDRAGAADAAVALLTMAIGLSQVWLDWDDGGVGGAVHGHRLARSVLALAATVPLLWRRRAPMLVAATVYGALVAQVLFVIPRVSFLAGLVPELIVTYSAAVYGPRRVRLVALAGTVAVEAAFYARIPEERVGGEILFGTFVVLGTWAVGEVVRRQWHQAEDVAERARSLVEARDVEAAAVLVEERSRIARELHDIIAHSVSVMGVQAGAARMLLDTDRDGVRDALLEIEATSRSSVTELQRLLVMLRDHTGAAELQPQPGLSDVAALVERARAAGLTVTLSIEGEQRHVARGTDLALYRIVQEALTNALKHSGSPTSVRVGWLGDHVEVEVRDEGPVSPRANGSGPAHGLVGMRERVLLYGGTLEAAPTPEGGFRIWARLPLNPEQA